MNRTVVLLALISSVALWMPASAADTVPFHASIETQPHPVALPCFPVCHLDIPGTGIATHMGRISAPGESDINLLTLVQTGTFMLIAPNGDAMLMAFSGTFLPSGPTFDDPVTFSGTWTIVSGTGRFTGATGSGTYHGSAVATQGTLYLDGSVSTVGSTKK